MKPTKETVKMLLTVIVFTSLVVWGLIHLQDIGGFFAKIFVILSPVLAGLCLAFVINELLRPMETLWNRIAKILARLRQKRAERKALAEEYPVYYIRGNHEEGLATADWESYRAALAASRVQVLDNETVQLTAENGDRINLTGLWYKLDYYHKYASH